MQKEKFLNDNVTSGRTTKHLSSKETNTAALRTPRKSSRTATKTQRSSAKKTPLRIVIFCDGDFPTARQPLEILKGAAGGKGIIIACDGTVVNLVKHGISPDFIVGDMDTLSAANCKKYSDIIIKNPDQETNDQTKSFEFAMGLIEQQILFELTVGGISDFNCAASIAKSAANHLSINEYLARRTVSFEIYLLGTTGKREDHTLGNISLLADYAHKIEQFKRKMQKMSGSGKADMIQGCKAQEFQGRKVASAKSDVTQAASAQAASLQTSSTQGVPSYAEQIISAEQLLSSISVNICSVTDYGIFTPYLDSCTISGRKGGQVSIFSFDNSVKIKSSGLLFPTDKVKFDLWWKATLNEFRSSSATLTLSHPAKILIYKPFK